MTPSQRRWSRNIWLVILIIFLCAEIPGALKIAPWRTASETSWDLEEQHAISKPLLFGFLIGLATHIRFKTKFFHSVVGGIAISESARTFWGV